MDLAPLQSCCHLDKVCITGSLYVKALRSLSHHKDLTIMNSRANLWH